MKLRRRKLIAGLAVFAAVAGLAVLDANVTIDLERPSVAVR